MASSESLSKPPSEEALLAAFDLGLLNEGLLQLFLDAAFWGHRRFGQASFELILKNAKTSFEQALFSAGISPVSQFSQAVDNMLFYLSSPEHREAVDRFWDEAQEIRCSFDSDSDSEEALRKWAVELETNFRQGRPFKELNRALVPNPSSPSTKNKIHSRRQFHKFFRRSTYDGAQIN